MARWLAVEGFDLRVADTRAEPPQRASLAADCPSAEFIGGALAPALLDGVELVAISPGLAPTLPDVAALLKQAKAGKVEVVGEIELFARALARLKAERGYAPKVVGITGTNGKTTTTRLAGLLLERSGMKVAVAGNIAPAVLDVLRERARRATTCPRPGCSSCRASSWPPRARSSATPRSCSTSRRTTSTGTARWTRTPRPRRASSRRGRSRC